MLQTLVRPIWFGAFVAARMYLDEGRFTPLPTYAPGLIEGTWVTVQVAVGGCILAVPRGQWEASVALNIPRAAALRRIILPQAFVVMIPPWGDLFIELLKNPVLTSLITLTDLTVRARQLNDLTFDTFNIFNLVLLFYLVLSSAITLGMAATERRAARGLGRGRVS